jgi:hypothetical protein
MPRNTAKREVDSRDFQAPVKKEVMAAAEGPGQSIGDKIETQAVETVQGPEAMSMAEALAFNEEILTIIIHQAAEKNAENPVTVGVNGRMAYIFRGQKTNVPRKYVERLLRAQSDSVEQDITAREERDFNRLTVRPTQKYPLSVLHDPNPKGQAWMQAITQAA